jgi:hypothetical protein
VSRSSHQSAILLAAALAMLAGLPAGLSAQTVHMEVEPNDTKDTANAFTLAPGDTIRGYSTGLSTTVPGDSSVDYFRITVAPAPLNIYRNRLVLTTAGTAGHSGTIRGLSQAAGVINPASDTGPQSTFATTTPPRFLQWYGFGRQEQLIVRFGGNTNTTADYNAIFESQPVTATDLGSFPAGMITFTTLGQGHSTDTEFWVYDGNLNAIVDYGNDDAPPPPTSGTQSRLAREFTAGTYYLALSNANLANNLASPPDDRNRARDVLEFPDAIICSSSTANVNISFAVISNQTATPVPATKTGHYDIDWYRFTVTGNIATGACCTDAVGACAVMTEQACLAAGGVYHGNDTQCGSIVCQRFVRTVAGSGSAAGIGQFIDLMPGSSILITEVEYYITSTSAYGAPVQLDVWVHDGTYRQAESYDPEKWTLHETLLGTSVGGGFNFPLRVRLNNPILVQGGRTKALFLHTTLGTMHFRANTQRDPSLYDNGETILYSERYRFGTGGGGWNGNLTVNRDFMGAIHYIPADGMATGACCLPDGTCQPLALDACSAQGGIFRLGADCASVVCESQGACCYRDGSCSVVYQADCTGKNEGVWHGPGSTCAAAPCIVPGACCFPASLGGGCVILSAAECAAAGGSYQGDGTNCAQGNCWSPPVLWNNGPLVTGDTVAGQPAPAGTQFSEVQFGNTLFGANAYRIVLNIPGGYTIADDFVITGPGNWHIDEITVYAYRQHTAGGTFTRAYLEIWDGQPGTPGASVVFGDQTTDRLISSTFADLYRVANNTFALNRFVQTNRLAVDATLPPGHYWLRYSLEVESNEAIGNQSPFVTIVGSRGPVGANAIQSLGGPFHPILDDVNLPLVRQELPFVITGHVVDPPCYANCDGSTVPPILNVEDFTCFINEFAQAQLLPHEQQLMHYANCDQSTTPPVLNVEDFSCFINRFAQGCR